VLTVPVRLSRSQPVHHQESFAMAPASRCLPALAAVIGASLLLALPARAPALAQAPETLPGGASSVQETHGAWTVSCRLVEGRKVCGVSQVRTNQQTGQRSFAIELQPPRDGKIEGVLIMPFGLALGQGVKLTLDDKALGQTTPFSTCFPNGCLAPVSLPTSATDAMKKAKTMAVTAMPFDRIEPVVFAITLDGFAQALGRVAELAK
jgi:invasion protein IalB